MAEKISPTPSLAPSLADEARYLHASLFRQALDAGAVGRYEAAHRQLFGNATSTLVSTIVARRLDAEAVEFALRRRGLGRELTRKMQMLVFLAEVRSAYYCEFVNTEPSRLQAWTRLLAATGGGAWKFLKGEYLVRRHGLL
jgi:hypothetical protein